jgi:hypothetical protein
MCEATWLPRWRCSTAYERQPRVPRRWFGRDFSDTVFLAYEQGRRDAKIRVMHAAGDPQGPGTAESRETDEERLNRNLTELLGELRVAIPGVQVLFAFLLAVPFSQRFGRVGPFERVDYLVTLLLTAVASALLIAPSAYHRMEFRLGDRANIVAVAHRLMLAGFVFLALAMTSAVLLVTRYLFSVPTTIAVVVFVAVMFAMLWYILPALRRHARRTRLAGPNDVHR